MLLQLIECSNTFKSPSFKKVNSIAILNGTQAAGDHNEGAAAFEIFYCLRYLLFVDLILRYAKSDVVKAAYVKVIVKSGDFELFKKATYGIEM